MIKNDFFLIEMIVIMAIIITKKNVNMNCTVFQIIIEQLIPSGKYSIEILANMFYENMIQLQDKCPDMIFTSLEQLEEVEPRVWVEIMVKIGNDINQVPGN